MEINIAFFRGRGGFINKVVRWWTKSEYSHAELVMPDGLTWIGISPFKTSKLQARYNLDYDPSEWDFIAIEITEKQLKIINEFFEFTKGSHYDWVGMILSQLLPYNIKRKNKWYCSEWIAYALRISCVIDWREIKIYDRADLSPAMLYRLLDELELNNEI